MEKRKVIYYSDELNDEFSTFKTEAPVIDGSYKYIDDSLSKRISGFIIYRLIMYPIAFLYSKLVFRRKIVGKEKLRPYKKMGIFLYGNHTQPVGDAFMQSCLTYPRKNYVIVHPNNLKVPVIGRFTPLLGALPLPDGMAAYKNFREAINCRINGGSPVVIYPEAHIWPYYTRIRPFPDTSFTYPAELDAPCFCFVNTYKKRKFFKRPKIVTYIDGPFFPDKSLDKRKRRDALRNAVYQSMTALSKHSDAEYIKYIKREETDG